MRKHGGTLSWRDKHVTQAANSPPGVARGRFVEGQQSGVAGSKPPPLYTRGASSCSSQGRRQENHGAPLHDPVHLPTYLHRPLRLPMQFMRKTRSRPCRGEPWEGPTDMVEAIQAETCG